MAKVRTVLSRAAWQRAAQAHQRRADALTADHRQRRAQGRSHPVHDFLFTYYTLSPAKLRRWVPGPEVVLAGADPDPARWRWHRQVMIATADRADEHRRGLLLDTEALAAARGNAARFVRELLTRTAARPAQHGCFGLHEWAMVYRAPTEQVRHPWPLRLGAAGTDAVVRAHSLRCTHVDAYRFFTADAAPRNAVRPTRQHQVTLEQPGCLHAGMDLYKWAYTLGPAVPGDLLLDAFELASDIRVMDMRGSPYDLRDLGLSAVAIETPAGKAEYVAAQRAFTARAGTLRDRLLGACQRLLAGDRAGPPATTSAGDEPAVHEDRDDLVGTQLGGDVDVPQVAPRDQLLTAGAGREHR